MTVLSKVDTLIFDLGGVIIDIDPSGCMDRFASLAPKDAGLALEKGLQHELLLNYEQGNITTEQFLEGLRLELKLNDITNDTLIEVWNSMLVGIKPGKIKLLEALRESHSLVILSNTNHLHRLGFDGIVQANFGQTALSYYVQKAYYSYEIGLRKPDEAIYRHVLEDLKVKAERTLFFDDNEQNILAARAFGMQASLITEERGIEKWFNKEGISIDEHS
jgi:putative hydrolase of the HAD superfamily